MGIIKIDWELCNGCRICVDYCPMDVLRMDDNARKAYIKYLRDCQGCFQCEWECPQKAIRCEPLFEGRVVPVLP